MNLIGRKPPVKVDDKTKKKKKKKKKEGEEADATTEENEEEIPVDRCVWMFETEDGWVQYPKGMTRTCF